MIGTQIYTLARAYRATLGAELEKWQRAPETQQFIRRTRTAAAAYQLCVRAVPKMGRGLFTRKGISRAGVRVGLYFGELTGDETSDGDYKIDFPYLAPFQGRLFLDAQKRMSIKWNIAYANHSCRRFNCVLVDVKLGWGTFLMLQTLRKIAPGEQLLIDYDKDSTGRFSYWRQGATTSRNAVAVIRCACETVCPRLRYRVKKE